jgi:hypothetical protein
MNERPIPTPEPGIDWLDAALREDGREHRAGYVSDDGFTARVMAMLPAPVALPAWRKPALAVLWAGAGIGIALALPGTVTDITREWFRVVGGHPVSLAQIAGALVVLGVGSWSAMLLALRRG